MIHSRYLKFKIDIIENPATGRWKGAIFKKNKLAPLGWNWVNDIEYFKSPGTVLVRAKDWIDESLKVSE